MRFLDLFAGIGGFRLGMERAGHECIGFCEIDKFARASYKAIHDTTGEIDIAETYKVECELKQEGKNMYLEENFFVKPVGKGRYWK